MSHPTAQRENASARLRPWQSSPGSAVALALFAGACAATLANQVGHFWPGQSWLNAALVMSGLLASLAALAPTLAWPNVLLAAGLAAAIAGMVQAISAVTGFPFGQVDFTAAAGPRPLGLIPWWLPAAWAAIALTARGTARLSLHRSRQHPQHGYHVITLATALAILASVGLQSFGTHSAQLWKPEAMHPLPASGHLLHLFIQIAITPLLIDKFPSPRPPNYRPLAVWIGLNSYLIIGLWQAERWLEGAMPGLGILAVTVAAFFRATPTPDSTRRA